MSAATGNAPAAASVQMTGALRQRKLLCLYSEVVIHFFNEFTNDRESAEMNWAATQRTQPLSMTPMQRGNQLYGKPCKVADVYDECTFNDTFMKGANCTVCHSLQNCWASNPKARLTNIAFKVQSKLLIKKASIDLRVLETKTLRQNYSVKKVGKIRLPTLAPLDPPRNLVNHLQTSPSLL